MEISETTVKINLYNFVYLKYLVTVIQSQITLGTPKLHCKIYTLRDEKNQDHFCDEFSEKVSHRYFKNDSVNIVILCHNHPPTHRN